MPGTDTRATGSSARRRADAGSGSALNAGDTMSGTEVRRGSVVDMSPPFGTQTVEPEMRQERGQFSPPGVDDGIAQHVQDQKAEDRRGSRPRQESRIELRQLARVHAPGQLRLRGLECWRRLGGLGRSQAG